LADVDARRGDLEGGEEEKPEVSEGRRLMNRKVERRAEEIAKLQAHFEAKIASRHSEL